MTTDPTTPKLHVEEDRTLERADARWIRLRCPDPDCALFIEIRIEPASDGDALLELLQHGHWLIHANRDLAGDPS